MGRHRGVVAVVEEGPGHHPSIDDDGCSQRAVLAGPLHRLEISGPVGIPPARVSAPGALAASGGQWHRMARKIHHPQLIGRTAKPGCFRGGPGGSQALDGIVEPRRIGGWRIMC